jgi:hypothetical protein
MRFGSAASCLATPARGATASPDQSEIARLVRQRWATSCGPAIAQFLRSMSDGQYRARMRDTESQAREQKVLLEEVGGRAVPFGIPGGRGAECLTLFDKAMQAQGVHFLRSYVGAPPPGLNRSAWLDQLLDRTCAATAYGLPVPIAVGPQPNFTEHFVLAVDSRNGRRGSELRIYNPADGSLRWYGKNFLADPRWLAPTQTTPTVFYLPSQAQGS